MPLLLILFGIGTDYNILLFIRFKEELSHGKSIDESIFLAISFFTHQRQQLVIKKVKCGVKHLHLQQNILLYQL